MAYKVVDIYKDLPRTNCGDCGRGSCFAFATAVYLEAFPLERCPHLEEPGLSEMRARLEAGREEGEGRRPSSSEQALRNLLSELAAADFGELAAASGAEYRPDEEEGLRVRFLDQEYVVTRSDVTARASDPPNVWVKILILIYLTRADGRSVTGEWVGFRDLPNTVSKAQTFDACAARIAAGFAADEAALEPAVAAVGGRAVERGPADRAYRLDVLPRVPMLLLFWRSEEEFPARVTLLLDRSALGYLDQEALVFAGEALAGRLLGDDLSSLVG